MIALDKTAKIFGARIPKAWASRWPKSPQPTNAEKKDNTLSYRVGNFQVIFGLMPAPIPWSDLKDPCKHAIYWPDAAERMWAHKRHVIVTVMGDGTRIEQMNVLTQATIALTDACEGAIGVYWCNSSHVLPPKKFTEIACQFMPSDLPLPIWIAFRVARNPDGSSAGFTKGLAAFDQMEFEATNSPEAPEELRDRLLGLAEYVIRNGRVIKNGHTIGEDAKERIKVTYVKSSFGAEGDVMRLDYGGQKRSGSRMTTYGRIHALATLLCTIGFGYVLYTIVPILRGNLFRHILLIPIILVFGFILLVASDKILQQAFGLEAFGEPKT